MLTTTLVCRLSSDGNFRFSVFQFRQWMSNARISEWNEGLRALLSWSLLWNLGRKSIIQRISLKSIKTYNGPAHRSTTMGNHGWHRHKLSLHLLWTRPHLKILRGILNNDLFTLPDLTFHLGGIIFLVLKTSFLSYLRFVSLWNEFSYFSPSERAR